MEISGNDSGDSGIGQQAPPAPLGVSEFTFRPAEAALTGPQPLAEILGLRPDYIVDEVACFLVAGVGTLIDGLRSVAQPTSFAATRVVDSGQSKTITLVAAPSRLNTSDVEGFVVDYAGDRDRHPEIADYVATMARNDAMRPMAKLARLLTQTYGVDDLTAFCILRYQASHVRV